MLTALVVVLRSIGLICRGHRAVALENLALRQQMATLTRTVRRPQLRTRDRLFWILLAKAWPEWRAALLVGPARHCRAMAPPMATSSVDVALHADTSWAALHECCSSSARRHDGRCESAVGSASDSRRIVQAGPHGIRAHGVAALTATAGRSAQTWRTFLTIVDESSREHHRTSHCGSPAWALARSFPVRPAPGKSLCGEGDRINPARVSGPRDRPR